MHTAVIEIYVSLLASILTRLYPLNLDGCTFYWRLKDEPEFRKKTRGTTVMLSGFICQCHGVISGETVASLSFADKQIILDLYKIEHAKDPDFKPDLPEHGAFSIILPGAGKGKDGFWGGEDVGLQLRHVIPIFKVLHKDSNLRYIFDNSSTHDCWAEDALNVECLVGGSTMNKDWVPMRQGFFKDSDGNTVAQDMQYPSPVFNCTLDASQTPLLPSVLKELMELRGRSKGITKLLEERNLMPLPTQAALDVLTAAPGELSTCQVVIKQGQRKGQVCSVRLPCRSHKAVSSTTALSLSAAVSSMHTAVVDLPPLLALPDMSDPVAVSAISGLTEALGAKEFDIGEDGEHGSRAAIENAIAAAGLDKIRRDREQNIVPPPALPGMSVAAAPVVFSATLTGNFTAAAELGDVHMHGVADSIPSENRECQFKIKQGPRKNQLCGGKLPCRFHNPDLFKIRCDLCSLSVTDDPGRPNRINCCQRMLLSRQDDFKGQQCMLAEICNSFSTVGQRVEAIFLPKFHCELNCIEFLWGFMKRRVRCQVSGTISQHDFLRIIKEALVSCPVIMIRRWYRRMWKLVHLYEVGLPITVAKYICKKYSSHRTIPAALMDNVDNIKVLQTCKTTKTAIFEALRVIELQS